MPVKFAAGETNHVLINSPLRGNRSCLRNCGFRKTHLVFVWFFANSTFAEGRVSLLNIVSYNLRLGGKNKFQWQEIIKRYTPSVFLVQESNSPAEHFPGDNEVPAHTVWSPAVKNGKTLRWGSAVYVPECYPTVVRVPKKFRGWLVGAKVEHWNATPGCCDCTRFFSLHAPSGHGSYQKIVNAMLDYLLGFVDGGELVLGGDFNLAISSRHESEAGETRRADLRIQRRLSEEFELINCWRTANPNLPLEQTLRWSANPLEPYHCDAIFVPAKWAGWLDSCLVVSGDRWDQLSDHNPVVASFRTEV